MRSLNRAVRWPLAGLALWYVATVAFWAVRPLNDRVPVGTDATLKTPAAVSVKVSCNSLFSGAARSGAPLPALTPQPAGQPPLAYARTPCVHTQGQARALFVVDTLFVAGAVALVVWLGRRSGGDVPVKRLEPVPA